jgi:CBS domain-containing protein
VFIGFLVALRDAPLVGLWLVVLGWLVTRTARSRYNRARLEELLGGLHARDALDPHPQPIPATLALDTLVEQDSALKGGSGVYLVQRGGATVGIVDVVDADRVPRSRWPDTQVEAIMQPLEALRATVEPGSPLLDVVVRFERTRREAFPVLDPSAPGRLVGLVTRERVHQLMRARAQRAGGIVR